MRTHSDLRVGLAILSLAMLAGPAAGQGLLVETLPGERRPLPRPVPTPDPTPTGYRIASLDISARIRDQTAEVQMTQEFANTGSRPIEGSFLFPLPYDGAVDRLTLLVDGREIEAKLLPAKQARAAYEEIVRKNQDPALLEWLGHGLYRTSVFPIPPGAKRTVTLRYTQFCRQSLGTVDFTLPLRTARYTNGPLERLSVRVVLESTERLENIYVPHQTATIERPDPTRAVVRYEANDALPTADFRLFYQTVVDGFAASVVAYRPDPSQPGYFLALATPDLTGADSRTPGRTVVVVVDRSGSMSGEKMEQARGAAKFVVERLRPEDTFNIVAYDTAIEAFRPELQRADDATRADAIGFVEGLFAGGGTNIDGALSQSLAMLQDDERPSYVLFLTDGLPTAGELNEAKIVANAAQHNRVRARLFSFGVGFDVNSRLLDKLSRTGFGHTEFVRPNEDIEDAVSKLARRVDAAVLMDARFEWTLDGLDPEAGPIVQQMLPADKFDLFAGDQAFVVGRYRHAGRVQGTLRGEQDGSQRSWEFPAEFPASSRDVSNAFVARLWAVRRVGEILDRIDLEGRNDELIQELVALATEHGIVTEYTSFLADEGTNPNAVADHVQRGAGRLLALQEQSGQYAFQQRAAKSFLRSSQTPAAMSAESGGALSGGVRGLTADARLSARAQNNAIYLDAATNQTKVAANIRQIGGKTFVLREGVWVDSQVSDSQRQSAQTVERFSEAYFQLASVHGPEVGVYLATDEPLVIQLGDQVYQW
jgi:Ca-activated chloride channel homolog